MTLVEFLLARITEDQRYGEGDVEWDDHHPLHQPARALAECEAKRRIVGLHGESDDYPSFSSTRGVSPTCTACVRFHADMDCENEPWPCPTLRHLATVYADHPDYREEWKP